ncbi:MAG: hypothetical protein GJ676_04680 [Rhodobacteraceae bacterium]|nr:hypothetical protein [Paracoccaceae bacterium]
MSIDPLHTPLNNAEAQFALQLSPQALQYALRRDRIRKSLSLDHDQGDRWRRLNMVDLVEYSVFNEFLIATQLFEDPGPLLWTARTSCRVFACNLGAYKNGNLNARQFIQSFLYALDQCRDALPPVRKTLAKVSWQYSGTLFRVTLRHWRTLSDRAAAAKRIYAVEGCRYSA